MKIKSKPTTKKYREGHDRIWGECKPYTLKAEYMHPKGSGKKSYKWVDGKIVEVENKIRFRRIHENG